MTNIPFLATVSLLVVGVSGFRVLPMDGNPDLMIDEDLNLVEPKKDLWNVLLRPKAKTSFKSILKILNALDTRDRYSVIDERRPALTHQPAPVPSDIIVVKKNELSVERGQERIVLGSDANIVSEELPDRESLSEEHPVRLGLDSISLETDEQSDSDDSRANMNSKSQNSDSVSSSRSNPPKAEKLVQRDSIRHDADIPKSLHHFEIDKPRYQHSIRDGWIY